MSQRAVRMTHADLGDVEITVAESAVPVHLASGWTPVDEPDDMSPETAGGPVVLDQPEPALPADDEPAELGTPLQPADAEPPATSKKKGD